MKSRMFIVFVLVMGLALLLAWSVAAQGPEPEHPSGQYPPPAPPELVGDDDKPFPRQISPNKFRALAASTNIPLGQPGLSFRYVETFGVTEQAWLADSNHINNSNGLGLDGADNLWVSEWFGYRALKYNPAGVFQMSIGTAGVSPATDSTFSSPADVGVDANGNIWVVDCSPDRVLKFDSGGNYLTQIGVNWTEGTDNAHLRCPLGIAFDSTGNSYISDSGNHRVQIFNSSGVYSATLGESGVSGSDNAHFNWPDSLTVDSNDNIYVADSGNHRVQIFDSSGAYSATLGTGSCGTANTQLCSPSEVAVDSGGNIYVADSGNHRVQIFDGTLNYLATLGQTGVSGSDNAHFNWPEGVAVDSSGNIYVSDGNNFRVQKFDSSRVYQSTLGTTGVPYLTDNVRLNTPWGIALDLDGSIYVTENRGNRLVKLGADGTQQWTIGQAGVTGSDNIHFGSSWAGPEGNIAVDADKHIYVPDTGNNRIQIFNPNGTYYATFGNGGDGDYEFECPRAVAISPINDDIFVVDGCNHRVQIFDSTRIYKATLGVLNEPGSDNQHFNGPWGVAVDLGGNIYVADPENHRIQKCSLSGSNYACTTFAGVTGESGNDFDHLAHPMAVAVDSANRIYVADEWNHRIQIFDSTGVYLTTVGGSWGSSTGQMRSPRGLALDASGNLYVTDLDNHRIQKFAPGVPGWQQVNINGFGDRNNWWVGALGVFSNTLYAGTYNGNGAEVWQRDSGWTTVITSGFGITQNTGINHLVEFNGYLYAGTDNAMGAEVWRSSNGLNWTRVVSQGFGNPTTNSEITYFGIFSDTLYAAAGTWDSSNSQGVQVWRTSEGLSWTNVVTNGFGDANNSHIFVLEELDGYFYAGTLNRTTGGELWRSSTGGSGSWSPPWGQQVNTDGFGSASNDTVTTLAAFDGYLYAGTRNWNTGAEVWRSPDGTTWSKVIDNGFGEGSDNGWVDSLIVFDNALYAVTRNYQTGVKVWRTTDGMNWSQVNPDGFGDSNNSRTGDGDTAITVFQDQLYIGTMNNANGGEIWQMMHQIYLPLVLK